VAKVDFSKYLSPSSTSPKSNYNPRVLEEKKSYSAEESSMVSNQLINISQLIVF
jgi:hypothetical protein